MDFMDLNDHKKFMCATYILKNDARYWWNTVKMTSNVQEMTQEDFISKFNQKYYNCMAIKTQQNELINLKQGTMMVTEVVRKFGQLARLCPFLVCNEDERVRRTLEIF